MSSHTILDSKDSRSSAGQFQYTLATQAPRSLKGTRLLSAIIRTFTVFKETAWTPQPANPSTTVSFWDIRHLGPPSDDIVAHVGDIYLDISTIPVGVYQNTSTEWTSCWSELPNSKKKFLKLPHPHFKDVFLWTTKNGYSQNILLSYITQAELDFSRGGTEKDKQACILEDLDTFRPITTAQMLVARRADRRQARKDARLNYLDSSSKSSTMDTENGSDTMNVEEGLCDKGDDDEDHDSGDDEDGGNDEEDGDDEEDGKTLSSGEVAWGSDSVDKANNGYSSDEIEDITVLAQMILGEVKEISSMISTLVKCSASGTSSAKFGNSSTQMSTESNEPPRNFSSSAKTLRSGEVEWGIDFVNKANSYSSDEIEDITVLAEIILGEVKKISSMTSTLVKSSASGSGSAKLGNSSTQTSTESNESPGNFQSSSSTSYPPPKFESDSIHSLLSRLTAAIEKDRKAHLTKIDNCE